MLGLCLDFLLVSCNGKGGCLWLFYIFLVTESFERFFVDGIHVERGACVRFVDWQSLNVASAAPIRAILFHQLHNIREGVDSLLLQECLCFEIDIRINAVVEL